MSTWDPAADDRHRDVIVTRSWLDRTAWVAIPPAAAAEVIRGATALRWRVEPDPVANGAHVPGRTGAVPSLGPPHGHVVDLVDTGCARWAENRAAR